MSHCAPRLQILLWSQGEGVNPRHVVQNFFHLKSVTLAHTSYPKIAEGSLFEINMIQLRSQAYNPIRCIEVKE
jgi:hypothetical protein